VSAGLGHSLGIKTDGSLWAWGRNDSGQLGDGTTTNRHSPIRIGNESNWVSFSAGDAQQFAINRNGELWTWGGAIFFDDGSRTYRTSPARIGNDTNWAYLSANEGGLAIRTNGEIWNIRGMPTSASSWLGNNNNWVSVSGGRYAINRNGELWNLLMGPVRIGSDTNWAFVSAGDVNSFAIKTDGTLWGWGFGRLGDGTFTDERRSPVRIGRNTNWASVSAGFSHTLAIKTNGELWAWGSGFLGDGTTTPRHSPVRINF
jgi:alpha-tubulin suppressor-like RCC1 family protein